MTTKNNPEYKHVKLKSTISNSKMHWKYSETPTYFDIDIDFKLQFDIDKILNIYDDYYEYYWKNARKYLSEYSVFNKLDNLSEKLINDFSITGVVNTTETDIKDVINNLNRNKVDRKYCLGYSILFESDTNFKYKKNQMVDIGNYFVNYFENNILNDTDYYKINN